MTAQRLMFTTLLTGVSLLATLPASAQSPDTLVRLNALEEQVRELNGRIEEMNFLVLQMQEQLRLQKEDNEFRFQSLEGGAPQAGGFQQDGSLPQDGALEQNSGLESDRNLLPLPNDDVAESDLLGAGSIDGSGPSGNGTQLGAGPRTLGTIPADSVNEDPVENIVTGSLDLDAEFASDQALAEAVARAATPRALYETGTDFALAGEHERAEQVFRLHRKRFPGDATAADATYGLGEALLSQDRPEEAAEILLDGHEQFAGSTVAPDMLLKVGVAMSKLGNGDIACATFNEVDRLYPSQSTRTSTTLKHERDDAGC